MLLYPLSLPRKNKTHINVAMKLTEGPGYA